MATRGTAGVVRARACPSLTRRVTLIFTPTSTSAWALLLQLVAFSYAIRPGVSHLSYIGPCPLSFHRTQPRRTMHRHHRDACTSGLRVLLAVSQPCQFLRGA